jgi:hypothetical protein
MMINMNELKKMGLPTMCANALGAVGVVTFNQLLQVTTLELKTIPNLGAKGIEYILALVASKGHKLEGQELYEQLKARKKAKRTWVGLTDEEIEQGCRESWVTEQAWQSAVWWAEAKLRSKNT